MTGTGRAYEASKRLLALLVAALACVCVSACGSGGGSASNASASDEHKTAAAGGGTGTYMRDDEDADNDDRPYPLAGVEKTDSLSPVTLGKQADPADTRAVAALVKRYYAVAAAGDGVAACSMLDRALVSGFAGSQEGQAQGSAKACAAVVSPLLAAQRETFAADNVATLTVIDVRVKGTEGIAAVGFTSAPVRWMLIKREGGGWKIASLDDMGMS
jgi:hypothetical protein